MKITVHGALIAAVLSSATLPVAAQTAPAQPGLGGPAIAGLCLLSREAVFANAKVGVAASARLKQITDQAQAEVDAERKPIDADVASFRAQAAKLTPEQRAAREQALAPRLQAIQTKAQLRTREIDATRAKVREQIATQTQPIVAQAYKAKNCGLLVDRSSVLGGNMTNDLTAAVIAALDAKITTITFNREALPAR